jgi:adenylate cyclase
MTGSKSPSESTLEPPATRLHSGSRLAFAAPGRLFALAVLALMVAVRMLDPAPLTTIRLRGFDLEQEIAPRIYTPVPVRIVAIDEKSLSRYGQWPWPRTLVAKLVRRIAAGRPRVMGVDIIFAEADRFSPARLVDILPEIPPSLAHELTLLPPSEKILADAFRKVPTVLGEGVSEQAAVRRGPSRITMVRESGANPRPFLPSYPGLLRSLPELTAAERGRGVLVGEPDRDGIVRRIQMFIVTDGHLVPALTLEMLRVASGAGSVGIITGPGGVRGATVGKLFAPTDWRARAWPYFTPSLDNRYVSAADLLDGRHDPGGLSGGLVLLGVTGLGLVDQKQTPLGLMPGVEVEAQLIESILTGNLLRRPANIDWLEIALAFAAGLVIIFTLPYRHPRVASAIFAGLVLLLLGAGFVSFRRFHLLLDGTYPAFVVIATFGVMLAASLRAAEVARRRLGAALQSERESKARLEGELSAARAIQMGLLPQRLIGVSDCRDVDVYALIEPARMVGGDLYDFLLLDVKRLSFAIADVSGKGVPAALFMAMSKEVLHAATLSHGDALDQVFAEANARISAASNDMAGVGANMMFVTVFAGVLDLSTGRLIYVNAGHDAPFILGPESEARRLTSQGGPPLGSVDAFPYPVEQGQLAPGEMLLLYTDGVTEAENPAHSFYAEDRLERLLNSVPAESAKTVVEMVRDDVRRFSAGAEQADDITLLAVRWLGAHSG